MTVNCNCYMPEWAYFDWLQDQGWNTDEIREECLNFGYRYGHGYEYGNGFGFGDGYGYGNGYGYGYEH